MSKIVCETNFNIVSDNPTFSDIWPSETDWNNDLEQCPFKIDIPEDDKRTLYYLLYSRYGNTSIASSDTNRFKIKMYSIMFSYGPTWSKRLEIQSKVRKLGEEDLMIGSKVIVNHSFNPSSEPSTGSLAELTTINEQNTSTNKKSKIEALSLLNAMLATDVTENFLNRFKNLFIKICAPIMPVLYEDNDKEEY